MLFAGEITIPAGTSLNSPEISRLKLTKGLIHQIAVYFPPGNNCLAFITINRSTQQIWPSTADSYLKGNAIRLTGEVFHHLKAAPYQLQIRGYSPDAIHDHIVYYYVWLKLPWQMNPFSDQWYRLSQEDSLETGIEI